MNESSKNQAPNPKETPIIKLQTPASAVDSVFGIWGLGFIWSLELGIWSFGLPLTTNHERPQIRLSPIAEEPRLHRRGRAHARARHRGEHSDLQRRQCCPVASTVVPGARATVRRR